MQFVLFLFNMTPNFYPNYDVGVKKKGVWKEIFNSDKDVYGGNNQYNGLPLLAEDGAPEGRAYHISVKLASYGAMIFKLENPKKETKTHKKNTVTKKKKTTRKAKN